VFGIEYVEQLKKLVEGIVRGTIPIPAETDAVSKSFFNLPFDPVVARDGDVSVVFNPARIYFV
jgi:hypothetical protein